MTTAAATSTTNDSPAPQNYEYEYYYYDDDYGDSSGHGSSSVTGPYGLVTETVTGFADFVTTIGNTVIVFTPEGD